MLNCFSTSGKIKSKIEFIYANSNCFSTFGKIKSKSFVAGTLTWVSRVRAEYPNQLDYNGLLVHNFYYSILYIAYRTTSIFNIISTLQVSSNFFFYWGRILSQVIVSNYFCYLSQSPTLHSHHLKWQKNITYISSQLSIFMVKILQAY